jgi:hypothetical protein
VKFGTFFSIVTIVPFFFPPWLTRKISNNHKSMLLAEADEIPAEADGDTGGFDMWRYRVPFRT